MFLQISLFYLYGAGKNTLALRHQGKKGLRATDRRSLRSSSILGGCRRKAGGPKRGGVGARSGPHWKGGLGGNQMLFLSVGAILHTLGVVD